MPIHYMQGNWMMICKEVTFWFVKVSNLIFGGNSQKFAKIPQVSSVESITKLSRLIIDDRRSTVILRRCNRTDR